jgi:sugar phosphate isomerase/epimerase
MSKQIGLQLYSVREQMGKDFDGTIRAVAKMGYAGVEPAGFPGGSPEKAAKLFKELGLQVPSMHTALPVGPDTNRVLDEARAVGCRRVISGRGPDQFKTHESIQAMCDQFNEAAANCAKAGLSLGYHNHWWEYLPMDGRLAYEYMLQHLRPEVFFEIDTYWVKTGGADPAEVVRQLGGRVPLLHIKDGPCKQGEPMTAVGAGKMDFPPIVAAARHADWLIVELDACATDMMQAVQQSLDYLVEKKLGTGKK